MKIVHVSVCSYPYLSSWGYQENHMIDAHHRKGHEVIVITTAFIPKIYKEHLIADESFKQSVSTDSCGTKIIRLKYRFLLPNFINYRLRAYMGLYQYLEDEKPDVIFVHDLQFIDLFQVTKYIKNHPRCLLKGDLHVSAVNSANNTVSKLLLHRCLYRWIIRANYNKFHTIYYIADGCKSFFEKYYGITEKDIHMEELLLGGEVLTEKERLNRRLKIRKDLGLSPQNIMILHSGKLEKSKKTHELLSAFHEIRNNNLFMYVIGSIPESQREVLENDIKKDSRVTFLGWKSSDELKNYLCAADFYMQPGTQSSTLQTALCCGCPCAVNFEQNTQGGGYSHILNDKQVYPINSIEDIKNAILDLSQSSNLRRELVKNASEVVETKLDYNKQVERIVRP